jgi:hypothetical protein
MERRLTVQFGPSRSRRFGKAVAEAQSGPGECSELEPDRYRKSFLLGGDATVYAGLARLLERVRHWRGNRGQRRGRARLRLPRARDGLVRRLLPGTLRRLPPPLRLRDPAPLRALSAL